MVEGRGGSGKTGGVSSSWYRTYSTHPLAPFLDWGRGKSGGGFACPQRENYKRLSTDFTNADRYAKIRNEGMHTLTEPFPTFAAGSRPVSAFVGTASQTSDTFGEAVGYGPTKLASVGVRLERAELADLGSCGEVSSTLNTSWAVLCSADT